MVRELRRAASGEEVPSDERLQAIYWLLIDWEYADPEALLDGVPWSEPLGLLADQLEARPTLANFAVFTARVYAARLIREGRKNQALGVLEDALERHAQGYYTECLRLDLAMLLRDEHQFGRALEELRAAQKQIEDLQGRDDLSAEYAANLRMFEALLASELAATQEALGMSDAAEASFELADALAGALDEETGPAVFGGNHDVKRFALAQARELVAA